MQIDRLLESLRNDINAEQVVESLVEQTKPVEESVSLGQFLFRILFGLFTRLAWLIWSLPLMLWAFPYFIYVRFMWTTRIPVYLIMFAWAICFVDHNPTGFTTNGRPAGVRFTTDDFWQLWFVLAAPILCRTTLQFPSFLRSIHEKAEKEFSNAFDVEISLESHVTDCYKPTPPGSAADVYYEAQFADKVRHLIDNMPQNMEYDSIRRIVVPKKIDPHVGWDMYMSNRKRAERRRGRRPQPANTKALTFKFGPRYKLNEKEVNEDGEKLTKKTLIIIEHRHDGTETDLEKLGYALVKLGQKKASVEDNGETVKSQVSELGGHVDQTVESETTKVPVSELPEESVPDATKPPTIEAVSAQAEDVALVGFAEEEKIEEIAPISVIPEHKDEQAEPKLSEEEPYVEEEELAAGNTFIEAQQPPLEENIYGTDDVEFQPKTLQQDEADSINTVERVLLLAIETAPIATNIFSDVHDRTGKEDTIEENNRRFLAADLHILEELANDAEILPLREPENALAKTKPMSRLSEIYGPDFKFGFETFEETPVEEPIPTEYETAAAEVDCAAQIELPLTPEPEMMAECIPIPIGDDYDLHEFKLPLSLKSDVPPENLPLPLDDDSDLYDVLPAKAPRNDTEVTAVNPLVANVEPKQMQWVEPDEMELDGLFYQQETGQITHEDEDQILSDAPEPLPQEGYNAMPPVIYQDFFMMDDSTDVTQGQEQNRYDDDIDMMGVEVQGPGSTEDTEMIYRCPTPDELVATTLLQAVQGNSNLMIAGMDDDEYAAYVQQQQMQQQMQEQIRIPPHMQEQIQILAQLHQQHMQATEIVDPRQLATMSFPEQVAQTPTPSGQGVFMPEEQLNYNAPVQQAENHHEQYGQKVQPLGEGFFAQYEETDRSVDDFLAQMRAPLLEKSPEELERQGMYNPSNNQREGLGMVEAHQPQYHYMATGQDIRTDPASAEDVVMGNLEPAGHDVQQTHSDGERVILSEKDDKKIKPYTLQNAPVTEDQGLGNIFSKLDLTKTAPFTQEPGFNKVESNSSFNFTKLQEDEDDEVERMLVEAYEMDDRNESTESKEEKSPGCQDEGESASNEELVPLVAAQDGMERQEESTESIGEQEFGQGEGQTGSNEEEAGSSQPRQRLSTIPEVEEETGEAETEAASPVRTGILRRSRSPGDAEGRRVRRDFPASPDGEDEPG